MRACVLSAAANELHKQEEDYKNQVNSLDAKTKDQSIGQVARNKVIFARGVAVLIVMFGCRLCKSLRS